MDKKGPVLKKQKRGDGYAIDGSMPLAEFLTHPAVRALPHADKSLAFLRKECEFHGIPPSSNRSLMEQRLDLHAAGRPVTTTALYQQVHAEPEVQLDARHHQLPPIYARGEMQLLGVPHAVIRHCILPHLDVDDLFSLLRTCKYVHNDARDELQKRVESEFRATPRGATILALSALRFYEKSAASKFRTAVAKRRLPMLGRSTLIIHVLNKVMTDMKRLHGFEIVRLSTWATYDDAEAIKDCILCTIAKYGSIEGLLQDRARLRDLERGKREETAALLQGATERAKHAQRLVAEFGCPPFFGYTTETGFQYLPVAETLWKLVTAAQCKFLKSCRQHICRGNPVTLKLPTKGDARLPQTTSRILRSAATFSAPPPRRNLLLLEAMFVRTHLRLCNVELSDAQLTLQLGARIFADYATLGYGNVVIWGTDLNDTPHHESYHPYQVRSMFDLCHQLQLTRFPVIRVTFVRKDQSVPSVETFYMTDDTRRVLFPVVSISDCDWIGIELLENTRFIPV